MPPLVDPELMHMRRINRANFSASSLLAPAPLFQGLDPQLPPPPRPRRRRGSSKLRPCALSCFLPFRAHDRISPISRRRFFGGAVEVQPDACLGKGDSPEIPAPGGLGRRRIAPFGYTTDVGVPCFLGKCSIPRVMAPVPSKVMGGSIQRLRLMKMEMCWVEIPLPAYPGAAIPTVSIMRRLGSLLPLPRLRIRLDPKLATLVPRAMGTRMECARSRWAWHGKTRTNVCRHWSHHPITWRQWCG